MDINEDQHPTVPTLTGTRLTTAISMAVERLWPLVLPALIVLAVFLIISWSGLFRSLELNSRIAFGAVLALAFIANLWPLRLFRFPTNLDVEQRLETANNLSHQALSVQTDRPVGAETDVCVALWQEHKRRMAAKLNDVRPDHPRPQVHERDIYGLRALPALGLFVAFAYSLGGHGGALTDILHGPAAIPPLPPRIDAWITPPRYTGHAPIFLSLTAPATPLNVPENSEITVRVAGNTETPYALTGGIAPVTAKPANTKVDDEQPVLADQVLTAKLATDGAITLNNGETKIASWAFTVIKDLAPTIEFTGELTVASNGTLTLPYAVKDDYGVTTAKAEFALQGLPNAKPLYTLDDLLLSLPRHASKDGHAKTSKDLTASPMAGNEFQVTLTTKDAAGHEAKSATKTITLPEYYLASPLSKALAEDRRVLAADAASQLYVLDMIDALTIRPDDTIENPAHFIGIKSARWRLALSKSDDDLRDVVSYLWDIAKAIDKSSLSDAQRRLKQAQDKLAEALDKGASDEEIAKLTQELRQAMNDYMKELAENARKNPSTAKNDPNSKELRSSDLENMLKKMEELSKQGAKDQAKDLLAQLNDMMNNLQMKNGQGKDGQGGSAMDKKLNELGKLLHDQQKLQQDTFKQGREGRNGDADGEQGDQQGQGGRQPGQNGDNGQSDKGLGDKGKGSKPGEGDDGGSGGLQQRQNDLGDRLQGMMDGLKGLGLDPGQEFSDAGKAMGRAGKNLGEGKSGDAVGDQADALDALRKGAAGLMNQMKQAMGDKGGGQQPGGKKSGGEKDPLGRPRQSDGADFGANTKVPDDIDVQRAREILEAIRKRLSDSLSPEIERSYLERLLNFE